MKNLSKLTVLVTLLTLSALSHAQNNWQRYADTLVSEGCKGAAIIGQDGKLWASNQLWLRDGEAQNLLKGFNDSSIVSSGFKAEGSDYDFISATKSKIVGQRHYFKIYLHKTLKTAIACTTYYREDARASKKAKDLADYFIQNGY